MRLLFAICLLLFPVTAFAVIGDNAPPIPSTYVATHPRLGAPDNTFLNALWAARPTGYGGTNGAARYWNSADAWNSASPSNMMFCRQTLIAYLAEALNSGPRAASYLTKLQNLATNLTTWATNDGNWVPSMCGALVYDWAYATLGATAQGAYRTALAAMMVQYEGNFPGDSPYNDLLYISNFYALVPTIVATAIYSPSIAGENSAANLGHLRWAMDWFFNIMLPVWKHAMGGYEGCGASTTVSNTCGGGWHESWEYVNKGGAGLGFLEWYVPTLLGWANASGQMTLVAGVPQFFSDNGWIKNLAYQSIYQVKPDFNFEKIGAWSYPILQSELGAGDEGSAHLDGLAAIYDDAVLRDWSRRINHSGSAPDGFYPSAWPYYAPDSSSKTATASRGSSTLAKTKLFPGWGTAFFRTGWTESDTFASLRYGDNFWSHQVMDAGAFTIYNRGSLAMRSGTYRAGSNSPHFSFWTAQAIAQNTLLLEDSADVYAAETWGTREADGADHNRAVPNDGGQRRVGSAFSNYSFMATPTASPSDRSQWLRSIEYYKMGSLLAYTTETNNKYSYMAVDITAAYNNQYSLGAHTGSWNVREANTSNRTKRAKKVVRHFIFIPRGTAAYVVVYDQVVTTSSAFTKKWLIHSINDITVSSNSYTITRSENVTSVPYPGLWPNYWASQLSFDGSGTYQYAGKLYGWMTMAGSSPGGGTITKIGGAGSEFLIGATNYSECGFYGFSICSAVSGEETGTGPTTNQVKSVPGEGPLEAGGYRLEQTVGAAHLEDWFLNVMLATSTSDTNTVSTAPSTSVSGTNFVTTWQDASNTCLYTLTLPKYGTGGTLTIAGAGCAATL